MQFAHSIIFTLLGVTYLLPFNTIINSYGHYANSVQIKLVSPLHLLQILCIVYQLGGCIFNGLTAIGHIHLSGCEQRCGFIMSVVSVVNMLAILVLIWVPLIDWLQVLFLLALALSNSICQAFIDTCTLYFTQLFNDKRYILAYSSGINVCGTLHTILLIILSISFGSDYSRMLFSIYYGLTALLLCFPAIIYMTTFKWVVKRIVTAEERILSSRWNTHGRFYIALAGLNFFLTLFVYPSLLLRNPGAVNFPQYNNVIVFLGFNLSALIGNTMAMVVQAKAPLLAALLLIRFALLLPLIVLYLINVTPIGVLLILTIAHGAISGYSCSSVFYQSARLRNSGPNKIRLIRVVNFSISLGLLTGNGASFLFTHSY